MDIDLGFIPWSSLNNWLTQLLQNQYMQDYDMTSKESKKIHESDDRVQQLSAEAVYENGTLSVNIVKGDIKKENKSVWEENFSAMVSTLLPDRVRDLIDSFSDLIAQNLEPYIYSLLGGVLA